jgi:hypothetical protein
MAGVEGVGFASKSNLWPMLLISSRFSIVFDSQSYNNDFTILGFNNFWWKNSFFLLTNVINKQVNLAIFLVRIAILAILFRITTFKLSRWNRFYSTVEIPATANFRFRDQRKWGAAAAAPKPWSVPAWSRNPDLAQVRVPNSLPVWGRFYKTLSAQIYRQSPILSNLSLFI